MGKLLRVGRLPLERGGRMTLSDYIKKTEDKEPKTLDEAFQTGYRACIASFFSFCAISATNSELDRVFEKLLKIAEEN